MVCPFKTVRFCIKNYDLGLTGKNCTENILAMHWFRFNNSLHSSITIPHTYTHTSANLTASFFSLMHQILPIQANNGKPFRFRIGSVKSAQLFQLSAENFFRLRYESVPLQWLVSGSNFRNRRWDNLFQKWNRIGSKSDEINVSDSDPHWAVVVPTWHYFCSEFRQNCADLFGFSTELCRIWDYFMPRCAVVDTIFVRNFGRIVPTLRLFYAKLCRYWDYFSAELCRYCAEFQTIFAQIKLYQICVDLCYFRSTS